MGHSVPSWLYSSVKPTEVPSSAGMGVLGLGLACRFVLMEFLTSQRTWVLSGTVGEAPVLRPLFADPPVPFLLALRFWGGW